MKILIYIGHPGHVHYYRNLILDKNYSGLQFLVIARNKKPIPDLLNYFNIPYKLKNEGSSSKLGKLFYLLTGNISILFEAIKYGPDVLLSHGGVYTPLASLLPKTRTVTTEDTELATLSHFLSKIFSDYILTPDVFEKQLGKKQKKFKSYMEYAYLHSSNFKKNFDRVKKYGIKKEDKYILVRLVDWTAHHDFNVVKLSSNDKIDPINELSKKYKIIISYEESIPDILRPMALNILPEDLHHILAFASLYIGEGATTASEAAILGTPAIYINPMQVCYCKDQEDNYGLSYNLMDKGKILNKAFEILEFEKSEFVKRSEKMGNDKINTTKYLYEFLKNI